MDALHHVRAGEGIGSGEFGVNVIVVGNGVGDAWRPNAKISVNAIARRWGNIPVIELTVPIGDDDREFVQKLWLDQHCAEFDRVIWFDRDVIVRYDCPNLFDVVARGNFGCVSSDDCTVDHVNTGVMVFEPKRHADIFSESREMFATAAPLSRSAESSLSLAVKRSGRRQLLDKSFNRCDIVNRPNVGPKMTDYIWHFCGNESGDVNSQIDATIWQLPPLPVWSAPVIGFREAKKIIGFWHIAAMGDCLRIIAEQYRKLRESGLYDASEKIIVGFVGGRNRERELTIPILQDPKFEVFMTDDVSDYEYPTLARVWQEAQKNEQSFLCYYFHTKGASFSESPQRDAVNAWREYMEYFNIERWEDCVAVLNEHDTCGVELQCEQSHYSGNFWWATREYIRKLPDGYAFWEQNKNNRVEAEFYVCKAQPKAYCFNDFTENLYDFTLPPERYRK